MLARLYNASNPVTGERDAEKALMYFTAEHELESAQGFENVRRIVIERATAGLTPDQVRRAREAGLHLARNCDCKEG
jgi:hypothetical protein